MLRVIFTQYFYGHIDFLHILARFVQYFPVFMLFCSFCEISCSKIRKITQISKIIVFVSKIKVLVLFFALPLQAKTYNKRFCGHNMSGETLAKTKGMPMYVLGVQDKHRPVERLLRPKRLTFFLSRYRNGKIKAFK